MRSGKLNSVVIVGALIYSVVNLVVPGFLMFIGFASAFGAQDDSADSFITYTFGGGILLWFLLPILTGFLVSGAMKRKAQKSGQTVDAGTAAMSGGLATTLGQLPISLCALWLVSMSLSETRNVGLSFPVVLFAIAVPIISGLLGAGGALGGWITFYRQSS